MPKTETVRPRQTKSADTTSKTPLKPRRGPALATAPVQPTELEIAEGAYYRYLERHGDPGDEFNDWIQAEREICAARSIE